MKYFFIVSAFFVLFCSTFAAQPDLPKIKLQFNEDKPEITPTGKVVELEAGNLKLPKNSAASHLAVPGKEFIWTPSNLESRTTGGADIYSSFLTSDGSAAVIAERIGSSNKPNGVRFIVVDTSSGKVIRASKTLNINLHFASMIADDKLIAAVTLPGTDHELRLAKIDIGEESFELSDVISTAQPLFVASKSNIYVCENKRIQVYDIFDFSSVAECTVKNFTPVGIALSPDFSQLAVYAENTVELFDAQVHNNTLYSNGKYTYSDAAFSKCAPIKKDTFLFFTPGKNAVLLMNKEFIPLNNKSGEIFSVSPFDGTLVLENRLRGFEVYNFPNIKPIKKYSPRKMRPASRNDNTAIFFMPNKGKISKLLLTDHRGNLWKLEFSGKRGKKHPILLTDPTGIRQK